jgi:hypothetical protein
MRDFLGAGISHQICSILCCAVEFFEWLGGLLLESSFCVCIFCEVPEGRGASSKVTGVMGDPVWSSSFVPRAGFPHF